MATLSRRKLADRAASRLKAGDSKREVLQELAAYLIDTHRTGEAELVVRDIETRLTLNGVIVGTVVSARELTAAAKKDIEALIKHQYGEKSQVMLRERVDESLIGGIRLELPDRQMDASVKAKLEKLTV
jgi:F0F1-type ATP synthase delta subunit